MDQAKKSMQAINEANISAKKALELAHTLLKSTPTLDELKKEEKQIQPIPPPLLFEVNYGLFLYGTICLTHLVLYRTSKIKFCGVFY